MFSFSARRTGLPPRFSITPENVEVVPGSSVNLACAATGSPTPHIKWRIGDVDLTPEDNVTVGENVLTLNNIRESSLYTCVATSEMGSIVTDVYVEVKYE